MKDWFIVKIMAAEHQVETNILSSDLDIDGLLKLILSILVYGLGAAAVVGVIWAGILYLTARDNEQQVARAKMRLFEVAIGVLAWAVMFSVLNWLIPNFTSLGL